MDLSSSVPQAPFPSDQDASGRHFGPAVMEALQDVIASGTLTSTKGQWVRRLERDFAFMLGLPSAVACASATAALHAAFAALGLEPGEEVVTTPITDMGAIAPILYQGAIPAFADVDPATCNVTAATIEAALSERTRAIVVTHLFGNPCDMAPIMALAERRGLPVIEDCSQAFLASDAGRLVGTMGTIGVFSLQQGKHITCGEGGLAVTRDAALARQLRTFINKAWDYADPAPDHRSLALNYRMTELQGAVAAAQLDQLEGFVRIRRERAAQLDEALRGIPGIEGPQIRVDARHSYWRYALRIDSGVHPGGPAALARGLAGRGISAAPRYIKKPAFECELFTQQRTLGRSRWPFTLARAGALDYARERFTGVYAGLDSVVVLPWNEKLLPSHIDRIAQGIRESVADLPRPA